jgi:hypothetical protein
MAYTMTKTLLAYYTKAPEVFLRGSRFTDYTISHFILGFVGITPSHVKSPMGLCPTGLV